MTFCGKLLTESRKTSKLKALLPIPYEKKQPPIKYRPLFGSSSTLFYFDKNSVGIMANCLFHLRHFAKYLASSFVSEIFGQRGPR